MPLTKEEKTFTFEQKLAVTKYNDLLAEIGLEDTNYVIWAYEDAKAVKYTKDTNTQSGNAENETKKAFPKYYICNKAKQYCKRCGQSFANDEIARSRQIEIIHFRRITRNNSKVFEPALLELTCNSWRCHACYNPTAKPQYKTTEDDNSEILGINDKVISKKCKDFIATRALYMEQKTLAEIFDIDVNTVNQLLIGKINELDSERCWDNIQTLGIYTVCVGEKPREYCLCTNVEEETFIEWFPWSNHAMSNDFAEKLQLCKQNIRKIVTSIDDKACEFAAAKFPEIERQIDRVDVKERLLNAMKNVCRKEVKRLSPKTQQSIQTYWPLLEKDKTEIQGYKIRSISSICNEHPSIGYAYNLKESGYDIYRQATGQEQLVDSWLAADKHHFRPFIDLEEQMRDNHDGVVKFAEQSYGLSRERYEQCLLEVREPLDKYRTLNIEKTMKAVAKSEAERIANSKGITDENGVQQRTVKDQVSASIKSKVGTRFNPRVERGMLLYGLALRYNTRQTENRIFEELQMKMTDSIAAKFEIPGKNKYITLYNFGIPLAEMGDWLNIAFEFESVDLSVGMQDYWNCASRKKVLSDIVSPEKIQWENIDSFAEDDYFGGATANYYNWDSLGDEEAQCSFFKFDGLVGISEEYDISAHNIELSDSLQTIEECRTVMHRPFCKKRLHFCDKISGPLNQWERVFPAEGFENLVICVSKDRDDGINVLMTNMIPDHNLFRNVRCFPLYIYEKAEIMDEQLSFDDTLENRERQWIRRSAITDNIFTKFKNAYGDTVTKEDIFYYIYAILHSSFYNKICKVNADDSLPRIPMLKYFTEYVKIGRALTEVHLNYDKCVHPEELGITIDVHGYLHEIDSELWRVHFDKEKCAIYYNSDVTVRDIPMKAYDYILDGKTVVEWILNHYTKRTNWKNDIINKSDYMAESVLDLLISAISVSLKTLELVEQLP